MEAMPKTSYYVRAIWDDEASVYYSESNIPGLVIEADTLADFMDAAQELGPEMLEANVPGYIRNPAASHPSAALELACA